MEKFNKSILAALISLFIVLLNFASVKADTTTLHFIGTKPKSADTIHHINIFTHFLWNATLYKGGKEVACFTHCSPDTLGDCLEKADKIILTTVFNIDTNLLNKTYVFSYSVQGSFQLKINNVEIVNITKPIRIKHFALKKEYEEDDVYFSFREPRIFMQVMISNDDLSPRFTSNYQIGILKWKDKNTKDTYLTEEISITKLFFYLAIGIVLLIQFLFYKLRIENFYFSLFCIFYSIYLISDFVNLSAFVTNLFFALSAFSLDFLATYLSIVLTDMRRTKIPIIIFSLLVVLYIILQACMPYIDLENVLSVAGIVYLSYNTFVCIYLLFQGGTKRKWEVKFISYGFFSSIIIFIVFFIALSILSQTGSANDIQDSYYRYSYTIALFIIPLTIAIIIGKRNGINQHELVKQLEEIKMLSNQNIEKEKEKQAILSEQNIVLEQKVTERTKEVVLQKEIVEEKNREILDSIEYALRIQTAILPPQRIVKQYLEDSFILYKPKDIVAGDFYWMETVNDLVLFAACDCTGHGVPGAMVSVVCHNALNRAVREFNLTQPAAILDKTSEIVIENFAKSEEDIKDGMDISLCSFNLLTRELQWAGANNPLWLLQNGTINETRANKQPIGMSEDNHPFTNHTFTLNPGDKIYIFSDGFADQFGGDSGDTKLTRRQFKELILSMQDLPMLEQGRRLDKFIGEYRQGVEQIDDILVMGVKI